MYTDIHQQPHEYNINESNQRPESNAKTTTQQSYRRNILPTCVFSINKSFASKSNSTPQLPHKYIKSYGFK